VSFAEQYFAAYQRWRAAPEAFWAEAAQAVTWSRRYDQVWHGSSDPLGRWFSGGELNLCHNALDRHVERGFGEQLALIYESAMTGQTKTFTYAQLCDHVAALAGALLALGVRPGDRVVIYMPMVPEAVMAMLACARICAIHCVVFGGFAARELAVRIQDARPRIVLTASCGLEPGRTVPYKPLLDEALTLSEHAPMHCIVLQRPEHPAQLTSPRDLDWSETIAAAARAECIAVAAEAPSYILYTSGTTGRPKGVVRDTGGHAVALLWSMANVYGVRQGDVFWAASDIGWVVGHSYIVYGPLLAGCTTVLYEGKPVGTPDAGAFWRVVRKHRVQVLFAAPTAIRAIKRDDPEGRHLAVCDVSSLRALFLAGERADPDTVRWAEERLQTPVIDHWWQTETGWPIAANCLGLGLAPVKHGSATRPTPGFDVRVVDAQCRELPPGASGSLVIKLPLPPGCLSGLWGDPEECRKAYLHEFPGYYKTADAGLIDEDGYIYVMGRTDDIINVAGHRLSTGEIEEALSGHPDVAECAVIGVPDLVKGAVPLGLVVLKSGVTRDTDALVAELVARVRNHVGPVASFRRCSVVGRLPKTRSGKILRRTMRAIAAGLPYEVPPTIEDPSALGDVQRVLGAR
jgi:propionyl-CoA synthetase